MSESTGTVALVTGGSRGIGAAIARRLAAAGSDIAITYRAGAQAAESVAADIRGTGRRAVAIGADSADAGQVAAAVRRTAEELGGVDILVNNAGIFPAKPFAQFSVEEIDEALHIHARAAFVAAQTALEYMDRGGRIVNIGSNLSERALFDGLTLYNLSKSALNGFTRALARELGPRGVTVNLVQPGSTDTEMNPASGAHAGRQTQASALGGFGVAADVAEAVAYLAGPAGARVTGTALTVDGGTNA